MCQMLVLACVFCLSQAGLVARQDAAVTIQQIQAALGRGDVAGARSSVEAALRTYPNDPALQNFAGVIAAQQGELAAAMRYFTHFAPELETYYLFRLREKKWNRGNCMLSRPCGVGPALSHLRARRQLLGFKGLKTYTWTVNDPKDMLWCRDNGVDVFATDMPHIAVETFARADVGGSTVR